MTNSPVLPVRLPQWAYDRINEDVQSGKYRDRSDVARTIICAHYDTMPEDNVHPGGRPIPKAAPSGTHDSFPGVKKRSVRNGSTKR